MDSDLKCNRLTCRRSLADKAVVVSYPVKGFAEQDLPSSVRLRVSILEGYSTYRRFHLKLVLGSHIFCSEQALYLLNDRLQKYMHS